MKRVLTFILAMASALSLIACQNNGMEASGPNYNATSEANASALIYASGDYTRINPALDEHDQYSDL